MSSTSSLGQNVSSEVEESGLLSSAFVLVMLELVLVLALDGFVPVVLIVLVCMSAYDISQKDR